MFQFKTFPLHNQGPLWFIVTHPRMLYEKKNIARKVHYLWRTSRICCLRKKFMFLEKKYLLFEKKYLFLEKKIFFAWEKIFLSWEKIFVPWEKNICWSVFSRPQSLIWWRRRDENGRDLQNYVSRSGPLCRKIAPKRIFLTRLHPKGAHFKIMCTLDI